MTTFTNMLVMNQLIEVNLN